MNFFKRLLGRSKEGDAGVAAGDASPTHEPFDYEVRIVHLPERAAPRVWKTRSTHVEGGFIHITPPAEWGSEVPTSDPVSLYFMTDARSAEFDARLLPVSGGGAFVVKVARPENLVWKDKEGSSVHQKRKFLRVDVSLPAHLSLIIPTLAGSTLKVDEPHEARMVDLSLEGCSLLSDFDPGVQRLVEVRVLGPVFPLSVQAKTVRVQLGMQQGFQYNIALVFQNLTHVTKDMIGRYIIDNQKEKL